MNIVIVDDHKLFRIGLKEIISQSKEHAVVKEFADARSTREHLANCDADLVLIDIDLPDENGIQLMLSLKKIFATMKYAMLSMYKDQKFIKEAIAGKVNGYFYKDIDAEELLFGLRKIEHGGTYYSTQITDILLSELYDKGPIATLTDREKQVLHLMVDGYSSAEIATALEIGKRTVESYRANILAKFNFKNTPQLVKYAIEHKLFG